jgi:hypothetical protein
MFEVDINVVVCGESKKTLGKGVYLLGRVGSRAAQTETGMRGCGMDLGSSQLVAFCDAESSIVGAENGVDLLSEPRRVAELEGDRRCSRSTESRRFEEGRQPGGVGLEVRGKLEEDEAEFAGLAHRLEDRDQVGDVVVTVGKAFDVGDALRRLEAEAKERLGGRQPVFEHLRGGQRSEGVVDLDGTELRGVELEEFLSGRRGRVEGGFPCRVGPT